MWAEQCEPDEAEADHEDGAEDFRTAMRLASDRVHPDQAEQGDDAEAASENGCELIQHPQRIALPPGF